MALHIEENESGKFSYYGVVPSGLYKSVQVDEPVLGGWTVSNPHHSHYVRTSIEFDTEAKAVAHAESLGLKVN